MASYFMTKEDEDVLARDFALGPIIHSLKSLSYRVLYL